MSLVGEDGLGWVHLLQVSVTGDYIGQVGKMGKSYLTPDTFLKLFIILKIQFLICLSFDKRAKASCLNLSHRQVCSVISVAESTS